MIIRFLIFCVAILTASGGEAASGPTSYRVEFTDAAFTAAEVAAEINAPGDRLSMAGWGASQFPNGWAKFIRDIKATDCRKRAVALAAVPNKAEWTLLKPVPKLCLTYKVDLSFTRQPWPFGSEQAGIHLGDTLYLVSKALFVGPGAGGPVRVTFEAPAGYAVISPFDPQAGSPDAYSVPSVDALRQSSLVVSSTPPIRVATPGFDFLLVLIGDKQQGRAEVERVVKGVVPIYANLFSGEPHRRYLMTIMSAATPDSEAFFDSAAITDPLPLTRDALPAWGAEIAHEIFHIWNHGQQGRDETHEWFSEGLTEYYANRSMLRAGLITPEQFWAKAASEIGLYRFFLFSPAFEGTSIQKAGRNKGKYRLGVYNGGWAVGFALDRLIAERTGGAADLDTVMTLLRDRRVAGSGPVGLDQVAAAVDCAAGGSWASFFDRHVVGTDPLPLEAILARLGFELRVSAHDARAWILPGQGPTPPGRTGFEAAAPGAAWKPGQPCRTG